MEEIIVLGLLEKYEGWVRNGEIQFLETDSPEQRETLDLVNKLLDDFRKAEDGRKKAEEKGEKKDLSEVLDWYETHRKGTELWKQLANCALKSIDEGAKGNSVLFEYLDAATRFEDLLYGLDIYYRDHTIHSLWVYFIGEYILREPLSDLQGNLNWYLYNDIELYQKEYKYPRELVEFAKKKEKELNDKVNENRDAIWCVIALCHDLGYSLAKLNDLNATVSKVVGFFDLPDVKHIGYSLDVEHQYLVSQFLELMAMDVRIIPSENYKDAEVRIKEKVLTKCFRDDSTYWRLCRALEKKQHGILSSYLIYKILGIFADTSVRGAGEAWGLEDDEAVDNMIRGDILYAIAQHEFDFAHLNHLNSLADLLVVADELEEFSRYGRKLLSRKYYDTMARSEILLTTEELKKKFNNETKTEIYLEITILYHVEGQRGLEDFFTRKAEQVCKFYSLDQAEDKKILRPAFYRIKSIRVIAEKDETCLSFQSCSDSSKTLAIEGKGYCHAEHKLICSDYELLSEDGRTPLLKLLEKARSGKARPG